MLWKPKWIELQESIPGSSFLLIFKFNLFDLRVLYRVYYLSAKMFWNFPQLCFENVSRNKPIIVCRTCFIFQL